MVQDINHTQLLIFITQNMNTTFTQESFINKKEKLIYARKKIYIIFQIVDILYLSISLQKNTNRRRVSVNFQLSKI